MLRVLFVDSCYFKLVTIVGLLDCMALYVRQMYLTSMQMNTIPDCRFNLSANYDSQKIRKWFEQIISHLLRTHTHERREPTNLGDIPVFLAACGVCAFISLLLAGGIVYILLRFAACTSLVHFSASAIVKKSKSSIVH